MLVNRLEKLRENMPITIDDIQKQLSKTLAGTQYSEFGAPYVGKVRDCYVLGEKRIVIATDRLSCFDKVITTIPFKGQVLTELAIWWFEKASGIIDNHLISHPDPNVMLVKECSILPIEVVIRRYLAGSALRDYRSGRAASGVTFPAGIRDYGRLEAPTMTPSTKDTTGGHDMPISEQEIVSRGIASQALWNKVKDAALKLFELGSKIAAENGLILVDTKYEFGLIGDKLVLADEIHTLDSSRYWRASTYEERLKKGEAPEMLDKEPVRQWLLAQGWSGDGVAPEIPDSYRAEISLHYIKAFEEITGQRFEGDFAEPGPRILKTLLNSTK